LDELRIPWRGRRSRCGEALSPKARQMRLTADWLSWSFLAKRRVLQGVAPSGVSLQSLGHDFFGLGVVPLPRGSGPWFNKKVPRGRAPRSVWRQSPPVKLEVRNKPATSESLRPSLHLRMSCARKATLRVRRFCRASCASSFLSSAGMQTRGAGRPIIRASSRHGLLFYRQL
jgi:hypothetical protein